MDLVRQVNQESVGGLEALKRKIMFIFLKSIHPQTRQLNATTRNDKD